MTSIAEDIKRHSFSKGVNYPRYIDKNGSRGKQSTFLELMFFQNVNNLVTLPGMRSEHTLLNVVRSRGPGRVRDAVVIDNLEVRAKPGDANTR